MMARHFGLIGYPIAHSFSQRIYQEIFQSNGVNDAEYSLYPIKSLDKLPELVRDDPSLRGLNVTLPFKEKILSLLDEIDEKARIIGAVNCISLLRKEGNIKMKGYNNDSPAFLATITPLLQRHHTKALILGTGGASKAVAHALDKLGVSWLCVSRHPQPGEIGYPELQSLELKDYPVIVNTTPVGMYPDSLSCPDIPYHKITGDHLLYDLVYNPEKTVFMSEGESRGATVVNGLPMLKRQAEISWGIWNRND